MHYLLRLVDSRGNEFLEINFSLLPCDCVKDVDLLDYLLLQLSVNPLLTFFLLLLELLLEHFEFFCDLSINIFGDFLLHRICSDDLLLELRQH